MYGKACNAKKEMMMDLAPEDIHAFGTGKTENRKFWSRFGVMPDFSNKTVLDVGCGFGSLCIDIGLEGAGKVVGIDTDVYRIDFAKKNLAMNYPQLRNKIEFRSVDIKDYDDKAVFDYIVSKDTFEHIINLEENLSHMRKLLKMGGGVYAGFGPLYRSPFGDHGRTRIMIPWGHLLLPEKIIIKRLNRILNKTKNLLYDLGCAKTGILRYRITSIEDLGLNKMSLSGYLNLFRKTGFSVIDCRINQSKNPVVKILSFLRRFKFLEEYCTLNAYCILAREK